LSPNGEYLAWSENTPDSSGFTLENLKTGKQVSFVTEENTRLKFPGAPQLAFSPDGKLVAAGGTNRMGLWEVATGKKIHEIEDDVWGGLTPVFSPDGKTLAIGNRNSNPRLIETSTGKVLHVLEKTMTQGIRFNPAGTILATANVDGSVGLWDVATGKLLKEEKTAGEELYNVEWSPKGDLLVTSGREAKIIIWDAKELKPLKELDAPEWVICLRFSPDGSLLFTAGGTLEKSPDRKITIWGLENPKP
jgi:WD40 repeat protein